MSICIEKGVEKMEQESPAGSHEPDEPSAWRERFPSSQPSSSRSRSHADRLLRLLRIIETLQSGKVYKSQEIADLCEVSRRTVFRDISALQHAGLIVADVRWHYTQETAWLSNGRLRFRVTVDGLEKISWRILGCGDQAEVIEPKELRDRILSHAANMVRKYSTTL